MKKRILSLIMVFALCLSLLPMGVVATDAAETQEQTSSHLEITSPLQDRHEALAENWPQQAGESATSVGSAVATEIEKPANVGDLTASAQVAQREEDLYEANETVRAIVVLSDSSLMAQGFSTNAIAAQERPVMDAQQKLLRSQDAVLASIEKTVDSLSLGSSVEKRYSYTLVTNAMSLELPYGALEAVEQLPGVKSVFIAPVYNVPEDMTTNADAQPMTYATSGGIGAVNTWNLGYTGAGMRIAIIDTGLDLDHPSFAADPQGAEMTTEDISAVLNSLNAKENYPNLKADMLYRSKKIPYAFNYVDVDLDVTHDNDDMGDHGTHVAGIAAANQVDGTMVVGVAPDAQLLILKVFGKNGGAYFDDIIAATEDAIKLDADAINLSLGSPAGFTSAGPEVDAIFAQILNSDVVVSVAAGNSASAPNGNPTGTNVNLTSDPDNGIVSSPATYLGATAVASAENLTTCYNYFELSDGTKVPYNDVGAYAFYSLYHQDPQGIAEYVMVPGVGSLEDFANVSPAKDAHGNRLYAVSIAVIQRGTLDFATKQSNAYDAGFDAVIIYDNVEGSFINMVDAGVCPNVFISKAHGEAMAALADEIGHGIVNLKSSDDFYIVDSPAAGQMSDFTSWGVTSDLILTPDVTAPGGNILSSINNGHYGLMSGTSMAAPQIAGMSALVLQYLHETYPDYTDAELHTITESLLMSTATPIEEYEGVPYSPRRQGSGLANVADTIHSPVYLTVDNGTELTPKASLGDNKEGVFSFSFSLNNMTGKDQGYVLDGTLLTDMMVSVDGNKYMSETARLLTSDVVFTVSQNGRSDQYDYNEDGVVDDQDVQDFLDAVNGLAQVREGFDLNGDGVTDTADVQWLYELRAAGLGEDNFVMVPANGATAVTVSIFLNEEDKAYMDDNYPNGIYVEGFVRADALGSEAVDLSLPFMGFYGEWSDARIFDGAWYYEPDATPERYYNVLFTHYGTMDYNLGLNPYIAEDVYTTEHNVLSPNGDGYNDEIFEIYLGMLRSAVNVRFRYLDGEGKELFSTDYGSATKSYYNSSYGIMLPLIYSEYCEVYDFLNRDGSLAVDELEHVTLSIDAWLDDGDELVDDSIEVPIVIDTTAPELVGEVLYLYDEATDSRQITFTVKDNYDIAAVCMLTKGGGIYQMIPVNTKETGVDGETAELTVDVSDYDGEFQIALCDYGLNERYYNISFSGEKNYADNTFYVYRLLSAVPSGGNIYITAGYNGWHSFSDASEMLMHTSYAEGVKNVYAAEYVDGYVIAIDEAGSIFTTKLGSWERQTIGSLNVEVFPYPDFWPEYSLTYEYPALDMAMDYTTNTLYVLTDEAQQDYGGGGHLMTLNWLTGEFIDLGAIWVGENSDHQPLTLACDNDGVLYTIDAATGDLYTIDPETMTATLVGATGYAPLYQQAMTVDHATNKLYWAAYQNYTGESKFFELDKATGAVVAETDTEYNSQIAGLFKPYDSDTTADLIPDDAALTGITIPAAMDLAAGKSGTLKCQPLPYYAALDASQILWTSSDETVATVSGGVVTGVGAGKATITATVGEQSATCEITVISLKGELTFFDYGTEATSNSWYRLNVNAPSAGSKVQGAYANEFGFTAAAYVDGYVYGMDSGLGLYKLDPVTLEAECIREAESNPSHVYTAMAFNYADGYMYGIAYDGVDNFDLHRMNLRTGESQLVISGLQWMYSYVIGGMAIDYEGHFYLLGMDYSDQTVVTCGKLTGSDGYYYLENAATTVLPCIFITNFGSCVWSEANDGFFWADDAGNLNWIGANYFLEYIEDAYGGYEQPSLTLKHTSLGYMNGASLGSSGVAMVTGLYEVPANEPARPVAPIDDVTVTEALTVPVDGYSQIEVSVLPWTAEYTVEFVSADKSIATVDSKGLITGVSKGNTTITVTIYNADGSEYGTYEVAVTTIIANVDLYAYMISDGAVGGEKWMKINPARPKDAQFLANQEILSYAAAYYNGNLYTITQNPDKNYKIYLMVHDPLTFNIKEYKHYEIPYAVTDMAFDYTTGTMFVAVYGNDVPNGALAQIDLETGVLTAMDDCGVQINALTVDNNGQIYVLTDHNQLCTIDKETGTELTFIANTGAGGDFQGMVYDYNTGNTFFGHGSLYTLDLATGEKTNLGYIAGTYMQFCSLYTIPEQEPAVPESTPVTGISLPNRRAVAMGETLCLTATVLPVSVSQVAQDVVWSTSDPAIATVDENGVVTPVSAGVVTITATAAGTTISDSCSVTVLSEPQKFYLYNETTSTWVSLDKNTGAMTEVRKDQPEEAKITASIYHSETDTIYAFDANGYFYTLDPVTFERTKISDGVAGHKIYMEGPDGGYVGVQGEISDLAFDPATGHLLAVMNGLIDDGEGFFNISSKLVEINMEEGKMDEWGEYEIPVGSAIEIFSFYDASPMTRPANILIRDGYVYFVDTWMSAMLARAPLYYEEWEATDWSAAGHSYRCGSPSFLTHVTVLEWGFFFDSNSFVYDPVYDLTYVLYDLGESSRGDRRATVTLSTIDLGTGRLTTVAELGKEFVFNSLIIK